MKILSLVFKSTLFLLTVLLSCKQETFQGAASTDVLKVYYPDAEKSNGVVKALTETKMRIDSVGKTVNFPVPVYRGGFSDLNPISVNTSADNSSIPALIANGTLPANTVILNPDSYTLSDTDELKLDNNILKGYTTPKIKISALKQYAGKIAVLGLKISSSSKYQVNEELNKVTIIFEVDELLDLITPKSNMIDAGNWTILKINNDNNVVFDVKNDGSILASGGNWGHSGVYQELQVQANKNYKFDMKIKGSGASDTWFEVYVGTVKPVQFSDYNNGGLRRGLSTWDGCGAAPFNDLLSKVACLGSGGVMKFPASGKVYLVMRCGGGNLGTTGISMSEIDFRRFD